MRNKPLANNLCKGRKISDITLKNEKEKKRKRGTHNTGYYCLSRTCLKGALALATARKAELSL